MDPPSHLYYSQLAMWQVVIKAMPFYASLALLGVLMEGIDLFESLSGGNGMSVFYFLKFSNFYFLGIRGNEIRFNELEVLRG